MRAVPHASDPLLRRMTLDEWARLPDDEPGEFFEHDQDERDVTADRHDVAVRGQVPDPLVHLVDQADEQLKRELLPLPRLIFRRQVKESALLRLSAKPGRAKEPPNVSAEAYEALKNELQQKDRALADQAVELAILRKKTSGGSWDR